MSSILKALRRLEEEKSARREGNMDLARDILRLPGRRRHARPSWFLPAGGVSAIVLAAVAAFALLRTPEAPPPAIRGAAPVAPQVSIPAPPPAPDAPVPVKASKPAAPAALPAGMLRHLPAEEAVVEERIDDPGLPSAAKIRASAPKRPAAKSLPPLPPLPPRPADRSAAAAAKPERPALRLSGIVYQDDPEGRVAVVNDLPVMKGTSIEGATVTDILPDRVRLDFPDGRAVDLFLEP